MLSGTHPQKSGLPSMATLYQTRSRPSPGDALSMNCTRVPPVMCATARESGGPNAGRGGVLVAKMSVLPVIEPVVNAGAETAGADWYVTKFTSACGFTPYAAGPTQMSVPSGRG